ncbi:RING finger protein Etp1p [[Candida] jaroonii]|uniref:RING finger protein Etp1p n=1 Tax=[Candida] jaroonii TaxID=467808 RepID=A0ACA9YB83_9ASCO|nr:RING finger protein Etp1p [[Candida] jaroonii]
MIGTDCYHIIIEIPTDSQSKNDYRYSDLHITTIDNTKRKPLRKMSRSTEPIKAKFLGQGIVRLYREFDDDSDLEDINEDEETKPHKIEQDVSGDDTMLSIVSIPTYFTATDILGFIGESFIESITHIRIIKSERANRFLVLLKFNDILKTAEFQYKFDGKPFNSMEPENCHVVFVKSIKIDAGNHEDTKMLKSVKDSLIPFLLNDPFTSIKKDDNKLLELPTCPVCLERMDANITGLLTIPCQHTFHCQCLSKWKDDTCPICRYSNNVSNQKVRRSIRRLSQYNARQASVGSSSRSGSVSSAGPLSSGSALTGGSAIGSSSLLDSAIDNELEHCTECSMAENLWICLVCGNIGCSRYAPEQHSLKHFINSGHCFAMEMNTSRVWDYAGDNYVHRLITNESDGKLVELPDKNFQSVNEKYGNTESFDKVEEVGFEYSQLLISQLASQREYFESLLKENNVTIPLSRRNSSIVEVNHKVTDLEVKIDELTNHVSVLTTEVIPSLKDKIKAKDSKINILSKELNESKLFNDRLSEKVEFLHKTKKEVEDQNTDLQEQVKDLMFYLESQEKFKDEPQDVKDGTILIQPEASKSKKKNKKKK